jgi:hypothetical protein
MPRSAHRCTAAAAPTQPSSMSKMAERLLKMTPVMYRSAIVYIAPPSASSAMTGRCGQAMAAPVDRGWPLPNRAAGQRVPVGSRQRGAERVRAVRIVAEDASDGSLNAKTPQSVRHGSFRVVTASRRCDACC